MYLNYIQLSINKTIKFIWIGHVTRYYQEYILIIDEALVTYLLCEYKYVHTAIMTSREDTTFGIHTCCGGISYKSIGNYL